MVLYASSQEGTNTGNVGQAPARSSRRRSVLQVCGNVKGGLVARADRCPEGVTQLARARNTWA